MAIKVGYENLQYFFSSLLQRLAKQGTLDGDVESEKGIDLWLRKVCIMTRRILLLTVLLALWGTHSAQADLLIEVGKDIPAQGATTIDIFLKAATTMTLSEYGFELSISTPHDVDSLVQFVDFVPDFWDDPSYVFFGKTIGPIGIPGGDLGDTVWYGADLADSPVTLTAGETYLLARLELQHSSPPSPYDPVGQTFTVSLVDGANTYFFMDSGGTSSLPFSFSNGMVTLQDPSVIPEPGSLLLCAVVALGAVPYLRRRRLAKA